ncbi:hypothetical protein FOXYS1_4744 [Fusarium oxysporum]|uniref:3-hydroxyisobutyrate dehydrogenase n=1 Tax=Fusarium oxysporum TaxID=5507 RepID=A0A8H5AI58_FUSOX|nr:hypothetical protein FOXYS1_4744 [Fusarium oxysporum]
MTQTNGLTSTTYGFIGIGQMGWGMAMNLRKKISSSSKLVVCEVSAARLEQFVKEAEGEIEKAATPKEVAERADVVITMLPTSQHVQHVFTNPETGLLSAKPKGKPILFIECSTIEVTTSIEVGKAVKRSGTGTFIDAPVSGGPNGANKATLAIMAGGNESDFAKAEPILNMMGKNIFHCGPAGAGLATKQINNYLSSVCTVGVCEAMNMGVKYGLDPKVLAGVINGVTPGAASENDFVGGFSVELCKGVLDMAMELGKSVGAQSRLGDTILNIYDKAVKDERTKGRDSRSVYRLFADGDA